MHGETAGRLIPRGTNRPSRSVLRCHLLLFLLLLSSSRVPRLSPSASFPLLHRCISAAVWANQPPHWDYASLIAALAEGAADRLLSPVMFARRARTHTIPFLSLSFFLLQKCILRTLYRPRFCSTVTVTVSVPVEEGLGLYSGLGASGSAAAFLLLFLPSFFFEGG